jgi:hypothetical protein
MFLNMTLRITAQLLLFFKKKAQLILNGTMELWIHDKQTIYSKIPRLNLPAYISPTIAQQIK